MRVARFAVDGRIAHGLVREEAGGTLLDEIASPYEPAPIGRTHELAAVRLLCPTAPTKILALARSYREHAAELSNAVPSEPALFFKPPSALVAHGGAIVLPRGVGRIDYEGELVLVIGRRGRKLDRAAARAAILGVTCGNDVSARKLQKEDLQWARAKGFDTFAAVGPWMALGADGADLALETRVNGAVRQKARTSELLFDPVSIVVYCSAAMTLEPGDLIYTGTPAGVGELHGGDVAEVEIEGIGTLRNAVVDDD